MRIYIYMEPNWNVNVLFTVLKKKLLQALSWKLCAIPMSSSRSIRIWSYCICYSKGTLSTQGWHRMLILINCVTLCFKNLHHIQAFIIWPHDKVIAWGVLDFANCTEFSADTVIKFRIKTKGWIADFKNKQLLISRRWHQDNFGYQIW